MIYKNTFIVNSDGAAFSNAVSQAIDVMQNEGLYVEVLYQVTDGAYTAILLGRKR